MYKISMGNYKLVILATLAIPLLNSMCRKRKNGQTKNASLNATTVFNYPLPQTRYAPSFNEHLSPTNSIILSLSRS